MLDLDLDSFPFRQQYQNSFTLIKQIKIVVSSSFYGYFMKITHFIQKSVREIRLSCY